MNLLSYMLNDTVSYDDDGTLKVGLPDFIKFTLNPDSIPQGVKKIELSWSPLSTQQFLDSPSAKLLLIQFFNVVPCTVTHIILKDLAREWQISRLFNLPQQGDAAVPRLELAQIRLQKVYTTLLEGGRSYSGAMKLLFDTCHYAGQFAGNAVKNTAEYKNAQKLLLVYYPLASLKNILSKNQDVNGSLRELAVFPQYPDLNKLIEKEVDKLFAQQVDSYLCAIMKDLNKRLEIKENPDEMLAKLRQFQGSIRTMHDKPYYLQTTKMIALLEGIKATNIMVMQPPLEYPSTEVLDKSRIEQLVKMALQRFATITPDDGELYAAAQHVTYDLALALLRGMPRYHDSLEVSRTRVQAAIDVANVIANTEHKELVLQRATGLMESLDDAQERFSAKLGS